jgi:hypothetical protein
MSQQLFVAAESIFVAIAAVTLNGITKDPRLRSLVMQASRMNEKLKQ